MKETIKALALITIGVAVGRVSKPNKYIYKQPINVDIDEEEIERK